ncbi:hypothetical protein [Actomonas aquatica]|uniref:Tetratricopeptide repeat protein n=1 Tax=Actomonas aquatica TaxID=2866162 RepID=A0ABZ1C4A5_9BACT|nr:hypothetical protein [Opitutus sp. WL0086]WRQ86440.1 hypothetical protein K1X11_016615 [Opitutus sp. WL0086]
MNIADELAKQGRWIAWLSQETGQGVRRRLYIDARKWLVLFGVLAVLGYVAAGVGLQWWLDRRPHNQVEVTDLLLPWRWSGVPEKRAEGYALRGQDELAVGNVQAGLFLLRRALAGKPDFDAARVTLAKVYSEGGYYEGVRRTVEPQLAFGASRELLELWWRAAMAADDPAAVLTGVEDQLARADLDAERRWWLQRWQVRALAATEAWPEVWAVMDQAEMRDDRELAPLALRALVEMGRVEEAQGWAERFPTSDLEAAPLPRVLAARAAIAAEDAVKLREVLAALLAERATAPAAWVTALRLATEGEQRDLAVQYGRGFLARWGGKQSSVRFLLREVVATEDVVLARALFDEAELYQSLGGEDLLGLALVQVKAAAWTEVAATLAKVERWHESSGAAWPDWVRWLARVGDTAMEPTRRSELEAVVAAGRLHLNLFEVMLTGFERSGDWETVAMITAVGQRQHPHSRTLRQWAERVAAWRESERIQNPDAEVAVGSAPARTLPKNAAALDAEVAALADAERYEELGRLARHVRRAAPDWVGEAKGTLAAAEIWAAAGVDDWLLVRRLLAPQLQEEAKTWLPWTWGRVERLTQEGRWAAARQLVDLLMVVDPEAAAAWTAEHPEG